jgi:hypothetical protein
VKNPEFHARTKHIDVSAHYVRELAEDHKISLAYIQTDKMLADMLTKSWRKVRHLQNVEQIGLKRDILEVEGVLKVLPYMSWFSYVVK